jgi:transposase
LRVKTREEVTMTETEPMTPPSSGERPAPGLGRGGRMSRRRKLSAVLRLLRGEDLELVSRELGVTAARLTGWREDFLAAGEAALSPRQRDDRDLQIARLRAKVGELAITNELLGAKVEHLEAGRPLARRRSRR